MTPNSNQEEKEWWRDRMEETFDGLDFYKAYINREEINETVEQIVHEAERRTWEECRDLYAKECDRIAVTFGQAYKLEVFMKILDAKLKSLS